MKVVFFLAHYTNSVSSLWRFIWTNWTYTITDKYIVLCMCLRWTQFSQLFFLYAIDCILWINFVLMIVRILCFIFILSSNRTKMVWNCLCMCHETTACTACLVIFWYNDHILIVINKSIIRLLPFKPFFTESTFISFVSHESPVHL